MAGYVKVFDSLLDSTVWDTPQATRLVWITMLVMADRDGYVAASVPGLAKRAGVARDECEAALGVFMSPDLDSRTKLYEGRRIKEVDGGWHLLNYEKYRERHSAEEKRLKDAERQRRKYERDKAKRTQNLTEPHAVLTPPNAPSPNLAHASAEASATAEAKKEKSAPRRAAFAAPLPADWNPTPEHEAVAKEHGLDLKLEVFGFRGWADGRTDIKSPNGRFATWLLNSASRKARERGGKPFTAPDSGRVTPAPWVER